MFVFLQIIVFMCYGIMLNKWVLQTYQPDFMKSPLVYHPGHRAQVWRFFSYMFMHVGYEPQPQRTVKSVEVVADVTQQLEKKICRHLSASLFRCSLPSVWSSWASTHCCS